MTEQQAREMLIEHGVPEAILDVWSDEQSPLSFFWDKPDLFLAEELERFVPGLRGICPIFGQNGEAVIGYLPQIGRFIRFYYEEGLKGDAAIELMDQGYQQFASSILLEFFDAGMSDIYDEMVSILQFKRGGELRALLDADPYEKKAIEEFRSQLAVVQ